MCSISEDDSTFSCVGVSSAEVSGFLEQKSNEGKEFLFVVDILWSDGRTCCVRRSYKDFLEFRKNLDSYSRQWKEHIDLPTLTESSVLDILIWNKRNQAEQRETQLHTFVQKLINGNPLVVSLPLVVNFFEPRSTDPVPCKQMNTDEEDDPFSEELFDRKWVKQT